MKQPAAALAPPRPAGGHRLAAPAGVVLLLMVLAAAPAFATETLLVQGIQILTFLLFALSLNLLVGAGGMTSMGHAAMLATGGYVAGYLTRHAGLGMAVALPLGVLAAGVLAAVIGVFSIRRENAYFIMVTLAFGQLVYTALWKWTEVTGGDEGLIGFDPPVALRPTGAYYLFTLTLVAVSALLLWRITRSPFGAALSAARDNRRRAAFAGIDVRGVQLVAFVIAGLFAGLAGGLQAYFQRGMFVDSAGFLMSSDALVACVLGGTSFFAGPILGAVLFRILGIVVPGVTPYWLFVVGVIVMIVALALPDGLMSLPRRLARVRSRT
jgi:branched-chain amino acid transport system permease protein